MSKTMTQGEAVYQAVIAVMSDRDEGSKYEPNDKELESIYALVLQSFKSGETVHSKNPTEAQLIKYIPGLVNNWLRKDTRLNGGTQYVTKNPGSRAGSGDEAIKAMRTLLSLTDEPAARAQIQQEIDKRVAELKPKKELNVEALPESLRHLVNS